MPERATMDAIWQTICRALDVHELAEINAIWETVADISKIEAFAIWLLASKSGRERSSV